MKQTLGEKQVKVYKLMRSRLKFRFMNQDMEYLEVNCGEIIYMHTDTAKYHNILSKRKAS